MLHHHILLNNIKFILHKALHSLLDKVISHKHTQELYNIGCLFKKTDIGKNILESGVHISCTQPSKLSLMDNYVNIKKRKNLPPWVLSSHSH